MRGDPDRAGLESDSENGQVRPELGAAAWIAEYGIVLDVPTVGSAGDAREHSSRGAASASTHRNPNETPAEPLLIRLSAQKLWAEGRANPVWYECATWVGTWLTEDRVTWRTADGGWVAQLERSSNGQHVSLAVFHHDTYLGRYDARGFHGPSTRSHARRPRPAARSLPLPLAG